MHGSDRSRRGEGPAWQEAARPREARRASGSSWDLPAAARSSAQCLPTPPHRHAVPGGREAPLSSARKHSLCDQVSSRTPAVGVGTAPSSFLSASGGEERAPNVASPLCLQSHFHHRQPVGDKASPGWGAAGRGAACQGQRDPQTLRRQGDSRTVVLRYVQGWTKGPGQSGGRGGSQTTGPQESRRITPPASIPSLFRSN